MKIFLSQKKKKKRKINFFTHIFRNILNPKHFNALMLYLLIIINKNYLFQFRWNTVYINKKNISYDSCIVIIWISIINLSIHDIIPQENFLKTFHINTFIHINGKKLNSYVQIDLINAISIKHLFDLNSVSIINPISLKRFLTIKWFNDVPNEKILIKINNLRIHDILHIHISFLL